MKQPSIEAFRSHLRHMRTLDAEGLAEVFVNKDDYDEGAVLTAYCVTLEKGLIDEVKKLVAEQLQADPGDLEEYELYNDDHIMDFHFDFIVGSKLEQYVLEELKRAAIGFEAVNIQEDGEEYTRVFFNIESEDAVYDAYDAATNRLKENSEIEYIDDVDFDNYEAPQPEDAPHTYQVEKMLAASYYIIPIGFIIFLIAMWWLTR
jgi:hypothetical protein